MKTLLLALSLLVSSQAVAAPAKKAKPAPVTHIDMSGPSAPESEFPTISKKGSL